jgi:hypothetical protein
MPVVVAPSSPQQINLESVDATGGYLHRWAANRSALRGFEMRAGRSSLKLETLMLDVGKHIGAANRVC